MITIKCDVEEGTVHAHNQNDFPVHLSFANHGFPEFGVWVIDPGETLSLSNMNIEERPRGYSPDRKEKIYSEGLSPAPKFRKFDEAARNGNVDRIAGGY